MAAISAALLAASPARAAPAERLRARVAPDLRPALALVVDTSDASLANVDAPPDFDAAFNYAALLDASERCDVTRVYWRRGPGPAPDCASAGHVAWTAADASSGLSCERAREPLAVDGVFVAARLAQWDGTARGGVWRAPDPARDGALECREDRGAHGAAAGPLYASDGAAAWSRDPRDEIDWDQPPLGDVRILYSGQYLNFLRARASLGSTPRPAAELRDAALAAALRATPGLEVTLLRLSNDGGDGDAAGDGGMDVGAIGGEASTLTRATVGALLAPAGGPAPLAEAAVEALRVATGHRVDTGLDAHAAPAQSAPSIDSARDPSDPARYRDPYEQACRATAVALLAAAEPTADDSAARQAATLPGLADLRCNSDCLAALARRMAEADLRPDLPDAQRPALLLAATSPPPSAVATAALAGGETVVDLGRADGLLELFARALQHDGATLPDATLTPPALLAPANGESLSAFVGLERPAARRYTTGNLRRYGFAAPADTGEPTLLDRAGEIAVTADRALVSGTTSAWSAAVDGDDALAGGAAALLPAPALRQVYTDLAGDDLLAPGNLVATTNADITAASLGLPALAASALRDRLIAWLRGADVDDRDGDGDRAESSQVLGAPRAEAPLLLRYGPGEERVLSVGRDGRVQVFDATSGIESWSYLPAPVLATTAALVANEPRANPADALASTPRLHRHDANGDGRIRRADGDHLWLFLGLDAPPAWLALDLTDADAPRRLWRHDAATLAGMTDAATRPAIGRLRIGGGAQDAGAFVLLLATGHDSLLDGPVPQPDRSAPGLALVDAADGSVLWRASRDGGAGVDLAAPGLENGFAAAPRLVDLDGDGYVDRAYVLDILGRLWRLDFTNGANRDALARLHLVATLGASGGQPALAGLRFHQEPDVSLLRGAGTQRYLAIAFGSGNTARPRATTVTDRLYLLRDRAVTPDAPVAAAVSDAELVDVTIAGAAVAADAPGWRLSLDTRGPGEKSAAPAITLDGHVVFPTWQPLAPDPASPCHPPGGVAHAWTLTAAQGAAARVIDESEDRDDDPRSVELTDPRWPSRTRVVLAPNPHCDTGDCARIAVGTLGADAVPLELDTTARRTVWRDRGVDAGSR